MTQKLHFKDYEELPTHPLSHIRFKGVWDMQDLYEFMVDYFRERRYRFHEKVYKHKHPSPFGAERQYVWKAEKMATDFYAIEINVFIHTYDAHDVQVKMKDGTIRTFTKGRIYFEFGGKLARYPDGRFTKNRFSASLRLFLNHYIMRKKWIQIWDVLMYKEIQKLVWLVRRRLKMEYDEYEQKYWTGVHT